MSGPAMGSFAMGHRGITTTGLYIVDKRPRGLTGLLSVITALLTVRISTNIHSLKHSYFACAGKAHLKIKMFVFAGFNTANVYWLLNVTDCKVSIYVVDTKTKR